MTQAVAIVHCHYEPGGVTQVVQNHVDCLLPKMSIVLLSGPRRGGLRPSIIETTTCVEIPDLEYDAKQTDPVAASLLAQRGERLFESISKALHEQDKTPSDCVIHWHNHSLGKNAAAPIAIEKLAEAGWRVLLQIHDFAEDQRPQNYLHLIKQTGFGDSDSLDRFLYPTHANIQYAVLTSGDAESLREFGIARDRIHIIPNSVRLLQDADIDRDQAMRKISGAFGIDVASRWVLYPVRGIRRKNVGEFLLVCQLLRRKNRSMVGALTLRPDTAVEAASYDRWKRAAGRWVPNLVFDAGEHPDVSFTDNLAACHCVVSTSVAEGFGMAFLEPWLADRRVVARNLPGVTADFVRQGVRLQNLYEAVWIPGDHAWIDRMHDRWNQSRDHAWRKIPPSMRPSSSDSAPVSRQHDRIDFAMLGPSDQESVLAKMIDDDDFAESVSAMNIALIDAIVDEGNSSTREHNRLVIAFKYDAPSQRKQLMAAYQFSREPISRHWTTPPRMIDLIDRAHPFYPCRVEESPLDPAANPE